MIKSDIVGQLRNIKGDCTADQSRDSPSTGERFYECLLNDYVETVVGGMAAAAVTLAGHIFPLLLSLTLPLPLSFLSMDGTMSSTF